MSEVTFSALKADPEEGGIELLPSLCSECAHRSPDSLSKCEAFPDGIPFIIFMGEWDHYQNYPGDRGITFDPKVEVSKGEGPGHPFRGNQYVKGQCFSNASRWANDNAPEGSLVVHGTAHTDDGKTIDHAWVEHGDQVIDPTAGYSGSKDQYYKSTGAVANAKYEPHHALINAVRSGHQGPWADKEQFKKSVFKADISHVPRDYHGRWTKVGGNLGSNPGGVYMHLGEKHYVKFPHEPGQARAEQAADAVYTLLGVQTMQHKAQTIDGTLGSVSKWKQVDILGHDGWGKLDYRQKQQAANAFVASALTKNWDVVGMTYDNMGKDKYGNLAILDTGGSFNYRAQGAHKHFGTDAWVELNSMLNPEKTSGRVFGPLMRANPEVFIRAARRLKMTPDVKLKNIVLTSGMHNPEKNAEAILERKRAILHYFGV